MARAEKKTLKSIAEEEKAGLLWDGTMFNLPPRNPCFIGRERELAQIEEQLNAEKFGIIRQAISGLGGVGKTQLAAEFAYRAAKKGEYKLILWIGTESTDVMDEAYKKLADFLQVDVKADVGEFSASKIQELVHKRLIKACKGSKVLFVLDNVPDYDQIREYLGQLQGQLSTDLALHILITSRSEHWHEERPIILDTFTPQEAVEFIRKQPNFENEKEDSIIRLAENLHYFPLALDQAVAYISEHTDIDDYLELYTARKKFYLEKFSGDKNKYAVSLWTTWNLSLSKLSASAKEILFISSYLYADDIPKDFFDNLSLEERGEGIRDLRTYSLITLNSSRKSFKIHRLLQEVIRISIEEQDTDEKFNIITKALDIIEGKFVFNYTEHDIWKQEPSDKYLTHAQSLAEHVVAIDSSSLYKIGIKLYSRVSMYLAYMKPSFQNAKEMFKKTIDLINHYYGTDESSKYLLANMYIHLIRLEHPLENNEDKINRYIEQAMIIYDSEIPSISTEVDDLLLELRWDKNLRGHSGIKYDKSFAFYRLGAINLDQDYNSSAKFFFEKAIDVLGEENQASYYFARLLLDYSRLHCRYEELEEAEKKINLATEITSENFPSNSLLDRHITVCNVRLKLKGELMRRNKLPDCED